MEETKKSLPIAEIVTGVIIVIILIVYAVPRIVGWSEGSVVGTEATKLYYILQKARTSSAQKKHQVWVEFHGTTGYSIFEDVNRNGKADPGEPAQHLKLDPAIQFGINPKPAMQNVWGTATVSKPVDFADGKPKFFFKPNGQASNTGAVYLIAKTDMGNQNADIRAIKIIGTSGTFNILKYSPHESPPWK